MKNIYFIYFPIAKEIRHAKNNQNIWEYVYFYDDSSLSYVLDKIDLQLCDCEL